MNKEVPLEPRKKFNYNADPKIIYDTIVVGTGVVGYATAMYGVRMGLKTLIVGEIPGGMLVNTDAVENYPGFISISGPELVKRLENHAKDYDIDILNEKVGSVEKDSKGFKIKTKNKTFSGKTIVFATGTKWRNLDIPGEKEFKNKGVSRCALCDGPFFKNKIVAVIGGADSAVKEAIMLTQHAKKVYIIYRGEKVRPEPINMVCAEEKIKVGKLEIINNTNLTEIKGDKFVTHVILDKPYKGSKEFKVDGVFIEIGHIPNSELAKQIGVALNEKGQIIINRKSETNVAGVYAAGDVTDTDFKQAITGVGEGVQAAYHAYEYLSKNKKISFEKCNM